MNRNGMYKRQAAYEKRADAGTVGDGGAYVYGNTVYRLGAVRQEEPEWQEEPERRRARPGRQARPRHRIHPFIRKNRDKARHMSAGYVLFLAAALCAAAFILVNYIQLQAELPSLTKSVAAGKSELNALKNANDERQNKIANSLDLEEVRRIAICELGMAYAQEGQIVFYEGEGDDYMRRVPGENGQR